MKYISIFVYVNIEFMLLMITTLLFIVITSIIFFDDQLELQITDKAN